MRDKYKISGIYKIENLINKKIYIGSAIYIKSRWARHICDLKKNRHPNHHLQNSWNKYKKKSFKFTVLEKVPEKDLLNIEQFYINKLKPEYNISEKAASTLGCKHSEETKTKLRLIFKGRSPANKGIKHSEETKKLMKLRWEQRKKSGYMMSPEVKQKISMRLKGRKLTKEHIEKVSRANKGRIASKETIQKLRNRVYSIESRLKISRALTGKKQTKKHIENSKKAKLKKGLNKISEATKKKISIANKERWAFKKNLLKMTSDI